MIYEGTGTAFETWDVPVLLVRSIHVLLAIGFFVTLILAWYHGEKGRQRVGGTELWMVAALVVGLEGRFWKANPSHPIPSNRSSFRQRHPPRISSQEAP